MRRQGIPYTPGEPLPLHPGDIVYYISIDDYYSIREDKVHGVAIYDDRCCAVFDDGVFDIVTDCEIHNISEVLFRTRKDAENWKKKHLTDPPYTIRDCRKWVSPEMFIPEASSYSRVYVKLQTPDGILKAEAYYDDGSEYPEDKGFWDGTHRRSKRFDKVIAWISSKDYDNEGKEETKD